MRGDTSRLPLVLAAFVGGLALFVAGFFIAAEMRSAVASPAPAPAQSAGKLIDLGRITVSAGTEGWFPFADVSDCSQMRFMARATGPDQIQVVSLRTSPDGVIRVYTSSARLTESQGAPVDGFYTASALIQGPDRYLQVAVYSSVQADVDGWLWCATTSSGLAVGGIADLPPLAGIDGSPAHNYAIAAVLAFVAVVAFTAGGWYARRRWLG